VPVVPEELVVAEPEVVPVAEARVPEAQVVPVVQPGDRVVPVRLPLVAPVLGAVEVEAEAVRPCRL
jgi:hypothetical protein